MSSEILELAGPSCVFKSRVLGSGQSRHQSCAEETMRLVQKRVRAITPETRDDLELALRIEQVLDRRAQRRLTQFELIERIWLLVLATASAVLAGLGHVEAAGGAFGVGAGLSLARLARRAPSKERDGDQLLPPDIGDLIVTRDDPS